MALLKKLWIQLHFWIWFEVPPWQSSGARAKKAHAFFNFKYKIVKKTATQITIHVQKYEFMGVMALN